MEFLLIPLRLHKDDSERKNFKEFLANEKKIQKNFDFVLCHETCRKRKKKVLTRIR